MPYISNWEKWINLFWIYQKGKKHKSKLFVSIEVVITLGLTHDFHDDVFIFHPLYYTYFQI